MNEITIIIADDHQIVRDGLKSILEKERDFKIVSEIDDGVKTVRMVEQLQPNILLLDLFMPTIDGFEVLKQLAHRAPQTKVLVLSMSGQDEHILHAMRNGASGYVLKTSSRNVVPSIRSVISGGHPLPESMPVQRLKTLEKKIKSPEDDLYQSLTEREREVFQLVAKGHSSPEIGALLCISSRTVEIHRANMMRKLKCRSQSELIRYAFLKGIISAEG